MLREAGAHFGLGLGGASVTEKLVARPEPVPAGLAERLSRPRAPLAAVIGGRAVGLRVGAETARVNLVAMPVRIGAQGCRLHLAADLIDWLAEPLALEGAVAREEPLQRALLMELAALDFIRRLETSLGEEILLGMDGASAPVQVLDMVIEADGKSFPLCIELPDALAERLADFLDRAQPAEEADHSDVAVDLVIEAGSQDLSIEELADLAPGDVVMLASHRPVAVLGGVLAAPVRRQSDGVALDGPFYPLSHRAIAAALAEIGSGSESAHLVRLVAESARVTTSIGVIDSLKPRQALPLSSFDEMGVDLVIGDRRFGHGELVMIGSGMGMRIISLLPPAPSAAQDSQTA